MEPQSQQLSTEERKAEFAPEDKAEIQRLITGKLVEIMNRQQSLHEMSLVIIDKQLGLEQLKRMIEHYSEISKKKHNLDDEIIFQYGVHRYPVSRWKTQFNLERFYYKKALMSFNVMKEGLMNEGFTEEMILKILDGEYIKEMPK